MHLGNMKGSRDMLVPCSSAVQTRSVVTITVDQSCVQFILKPCFLQESGREMKH